MIQKWKKIMVVVLVVSILLTGHFTEVAGTYAKAASNKEIEITTQIKLLEAIWQGEYYANQGKTALSLDISEVTEQGTVKAEFIFSEHVDNSGVPSGNYEMEGTYDFSSHALKLSGTKWIEHPSGYNFVDIDGSVDLSSKAITGTTSGYSGLNLVRQDIIGEEEEVEGNYSGDMLEFITNKGTQNVMKYLCLDSNFPNSSFTYENDAKFGSQVTHFLSDAIYRGKDGWKDLFSGKTSEEEAEKLLTALLEYYQSDCQELAKAKTAEKCASLIVKAFNEYLKLDGIKTMLVDDELEVVKNAIDEKSVAEMLYKQKYDSLIVDLLEDKNISINADVNKKLLEFMESKQIVDSLSKGLKVFNDGLKILTFTQDTVNKLYELESILTANDMYCEMLTYLSENCLFDVVKTASKKLLAVIEGGVTEILNQMVKDITIDMAGDAADLVIDAVANKIWVVKVVKTSFEWGVNLANSYLNTGEVQQLKDCMRIQAYVGNCLSMWVLDNHNEFYSSIGTENENEKAKTFYFSLYMLWKTRLSGEETFRSMMIKATTAWSKYYTISARVSNALNSYKDNIFAQERLDSLLGTTVACPVDVEVYDATGKLVVTVKDGSESQGYVEGVYYYVSYQPLEKDYIKYIYFPEDKGYSIRCIGIGTGTVDCFIDSISDTGAMQEKYFEKIKVTEDTIISVDNISSSTKKYSVLDEASGNVKEYSFKQRKKVNASALAKVKKVKVKNQKNKIVLSWEKVSGAKGYHVVYGIGKKMKGEKKKLTKKTKITIKKLKKRKVYFFKVRAYQKKNGKRVYGQWSKVVKKKV